MTRKEAIEIIKSRLKFLGRANIKCGENTIEMLELSLAALQDQEERENPERLTIEQLKGMNCPVWVSFKPVIEGGENGYWCLCKFGEILAPSRSIFKVEDIPHWEFYRYERKEI